MPRPERERDSVSLADERLRERYEELRSLRETQPEREASHARQALQKCRTSSDALVAQLKAQLAAVQSGSGVASEDEVAQLKAENAELRRQLAATTAPPATDARISFYEIMTGMSVEMQGDLAKCTVVCAAPEDEDEETPAPPPHRISFEIDLVPAEGDPGDISYAPTDLSGCADANLPEYLRESIVFERTQAPTFLQRLIAGVAAE
jgi:hypothetical protein